MICGKWVQNGHILLDIFLNFKANGGPQSAEKLWGELMEPFVYGVEGFYGGQYSETHSNNKFTCL